MLVATVVTAMLWVLGVQMAYVFGIITFVLNFIPNLGPMIATFLPMPLVIFDPGELQQLFSNLAVVSFCAAARHVVRRKGRGCMFP